MSFKLFIYYSALCGAWAALLGWGLGRVVAPAGAYAATLSRGVTLGVLVAVAVGLVDALWNRRPAAERAKQLGVAAAVGAAGGLLGPLVGQLLIDKLTPGGNSLLEALFVLVGWVLMGTVVGAAAGAYELVLRWQHREEVAGALRKTRHGVLGGAVGGLAGGLLYLILLMIFRQSNLRSPSAFGLVALGLAIGLLTGLAQVILKEAWVKVEAGFRAGREVMLTKAETTIGRAESCDIGLFGDAAVERVHARIVQDGPRYLLADAGSPGGTFLNDQPVAAPTPLNSGDAIRVGNSILRFGERQKQAKSP